MSLSDSDTNTTTPADFNDALRLLEALLFAAPSPLDADALRERLPEGTDIAALMDELIAFYAPRGVNIVHVAGGWTVRTAPDLAPRLKLTQKVGRKLSRAAIETLAIVGYHQPVTRAEIEEIRGVVISKGTLDMLMEAGWIVPKGRKETVGRPVTWVTTEAFLLHFGLNSIADLPGVDELRAAGLIGPRPVSTLSETIGVPEGERLPPAIEDAEDNETEDDDIEETEEFAPVREGAPAEPEDAEREDAEAESAEVIVVETDAEEATDEDAEADDEDIDDEDADEDGEDASGDEEAADEGESDGHDHEH